MAHLINQEQYFVREKFCIIVGFFYNYIIKIMLIITFLNTV